MQDRAKANPKIEFAWNKVISQIVTETIELPGGGQNERITSLELKDTKDGSRSNLRVDGLFIAIGHQPNTALFAGQLPLDENGYLIVEKGSSKTSIPGVFACGDVQDHTYRQAITAAGSGCMAAIDAERWLAEQKGV
jgi:thioredoxin reductase (NADPH)